jgi:hypothetical protein
MGKAKSAKTTATEAIDRQTANRRAELAKQGLAKLQAGQPVSKAEERAIRDWENSQLERWGQQFAAACPKKTYCDHLGLSHKVAIEQSRRFGLPYHTSGPTIDLFAQLSAWHSWASENKHGITRIIKAKELAEALGDEDGLEFWQRELVKERAIRERDARLERQRELLPRQLFHQLLQEFYVDPMRRRIELLERRDESVCSELADNLRDDIESFQEGLRILFGEIDGSTAIAEPEAAG